MLRQAGLSPATRSSLPQAVRSTTKPASAVGRRLPLGRGNRLCVRRGCGAKAMAAALRDDRCDSSAAVTTTAWGTSIRFKAEGGGSVKAWLPLASHVPVLYSGCTGTGTLYCKVYLYPGCCIRLRITQIPSRVIPTASDDGSLVIVWCVVDPGTRVTNWRVH